MKNTKGITLVALVITIIILLILAGITISQLTGSGLFENAKLAEQKSEEAEEKEDQTLADYENKIGKYVDGTRDDELKAEIESLKAQIAELQVETIPFTWNSDIEKSNEIINIKKYGHVISGYIRSTITLTAKQWTEIGSIDMQYAPGRSMIVPGCIGASDNNIEIMISTDGKISVRPLRDLSNTVGNWFSVNFTYIK